MTLTAAEEKPASTAKPDFMELFFQTVHAHQRSESLKAAIQLGVFTAIGDGAEAEEIASRCNASVRGIRILCDYLVMVGFIEKAKTGGYKLTPDSKTFLDSRSPFFVGGTVELMLSPHMTDGFKDLATVVRTGTTTLERGGILAPEHPVWVNFARTMTPLVRMPAEVLASILGSDTARSWKVLDVAAGSGLFGIAVAKRYPRSQVVALDWQNVLAIAKENAVSEGVASRYSVIPGSAFEVELGRDYDVALVPNFLHHFDLGTIETFMSKIFEALKPGGRAVLLEIVPNEDRISPPNSVTFSMIMLGNTKGGNAYTFSEFQSILQRIGFANVELRPMPPTPFSVIFAEKA
jgi:2-polyprenyl-3-methyl-5-hydroxy-6-metoxy-1,4-benzoquinol methylase/predicted transcriptional regulator